MAESPIHTMQTCPVKTIYDMHCWFTCQGQVVSIVLGCSTTSEPAVSHPLVERPLAFFKQNPGPWNPKASDYTSNSPARSPESWLPNNSLHNAQWLMGWFLLEELVSGLSTSRVVVPSQTFNHNLSPLIAHHYAFINHNLSPSLTILITITKHHH